MESQATFTGLPLELRVAIYDQLFEHNRDKVIVACCPRHIPTVATNKTVVWASSDHESLLIDYIRDFAALHGTNKTIAAELDTICFQEWCLSLCVHHFHSDQNFDWPMQHSRLAGRLFLRSAGELPSILKGMPTDICSLARCIKHTTLRVRYGSFPHNHHDARITHHWSGIDSIRNMVRLAGDKRPGTYLTVNLVLSQDTFHAFDVDEFKTDCLPILEQVPDHINLTLGCYDADPDYTHRREDEGSIVKALNIDEEYLTKLQGPDRTAHFRIRDESLMFAFYRLIDFTDSAFARIELRPRVWWHKAPKPDGGSKTVKHWLTIAWEARETGDRAQFELA